MQIIVFSDSHGRIHNAVFSIEELGTVDHILHLGDVRQDASDLGVVFPHIPITAISGNSEIGAGSLFEKTIELGGKRIFLCHGHTYHVKNGLSALAAKGKEENADLVLFGHTHEPFDGVVDGVHLFNPGSISLPATGGPSFGIIEIKDGVLRTSHKTR